MNLRLQALQYEISDFSFLYISLNGVEKVSIYLHLLFNGTILDQLRRHKNIAVYDNQRWEYEQKILKETLYNQTNMSHGIAHDLYVHNAVKIPFIVENNMKAQEFPDSLRDKLKQFGDMTYAGLDKHFKDYYSKSIEESEKANASIFNGYIEDIPDSTDNGEIVGDDSSRDQRNEDHDPILGSLINMFDELVSE